jgi:hypothetical protein
MKQEFLPYDRALKLKEIGFDEPCLDFYDDNQELFYNHENKEKIHIGDSVKAPLFQQAFRWFREDHRLNSHIHHEDIDNYSYCCGIGYSEDIGGYQDFKTYEEAELACLDEMIKIVIKQK